MNNKIVRVIRYTLFLLVLFVPIIYSSMTYEMYEMPKMFFIYFLGSIIIFLFLILAALYNITFVLPPRETVLYFIFFLLSVVFSNHIYTSIWGYYTRFTDSLLSNATFFLLFIVVINVIDKKSVRIIKRFIYFSSLPILIYGLTQITNVPRIYSTFGQPNWYAVYIIMVIPLIIEDLIAVKNIHIKMGLFFLLFLSFINLFFTHSLSGILGFILGMVYLVYVFRKKIKLKWFLITISCILFFSFLNFSYLKQRIGDAVTFSTDPSAYAISDPNLIRVGLWKSSLALLLSSPKNILVGLGPENSAYYMPYHRKDVLNYTSEWNFIFNKPHNYYIELFLESGVLAFISFFLVMSYTLRSKNKYLVSALLSFFVAIFFGWPTVSTWLLFWLYIAFIYIEKREI